MLKIISLLSNWTRWFPAYHSPIGSVCMCVCVCVRTHACVYARTRVCVCVCVETRKEGDSCFLNWSDTVKLPPLILPTSCAS